MKRKLAIFLIRRFPTQDRAALIREANEDLGDNGRDVFVRGLIGRGFHIHRDPRKKERTAG
jgi:DNA-binding winged helix-turn-helix (wHTH) protein